MKIDKSKTIIQIQASGVPPKISKKNRKSSNGRKIARVARNLTIFGPNRSRRRELKFEKFPNERANKQTNERLVQNFFENFSKNICTNRSFVRLLVRSKNFQILVRADAIDLVQKSSNFEPSSRFFGRLKILDSKRRQNEAFEFDSSCKAL